MQVQVDIIVAVAMLGILISALKRIDRNAERIEEQERKHREFLKRKYIDEETRPDTRY